MCEDNHDILKPKISFKKYVIIHCWHIRRQTQCLIVPVCTSLQYSAEYCLAINAARSRARSVPEWYHSIQMSIIE